MSVSPASSQIPIVTLRDVGKTFGSGTVALDHLDLATGDGESRLVAGAVRLRQVHRAAHHRRARRALRGHGGWARRSALCSRSRR